MNLDDYTTNGDLTPQNDPDYKDIVMLHLTEEVMSMTEAIVFFEEEEEFEKCSVLQEAIAEKIKDGYEILEEFGGTEEEFRYLDGLPQLSIEIFRAKSKLLAGLNELEDFDFGFDDDEEE